MRRILFALTALTGFADVAQAHVSGAPAAQHTMGHAWLLLWLLPAGIIGLRLFRRGG